MNRIFSLLPLLCFLWCSSCRPKYSPAPVYIAFNDFENVAGWISEPTNNNLTVEKAGGYSGRCYSRINKNNHFSYIFRASFKELTDKKIYWVRVSAKCKKKDAKINRATVVCNIQDSTNTYVYWQELPLATDFYGKTNEWVSIVKTFEISSKYRPSNYLGAFIWNGDKEDDLMIDDFRIEFFN
jgi:hypothetical protein